MIKGVSNIEHSMLDFHKKNLIYTTNIYVSIFGDSLNYWCMISKWKI